VDAREPLGEAFALGVDDEVHVALSIERDVLRAMLGHPGETHALEQGAERHGIGGGILDELEPVGTHWIHFVELQDLGFNDGRHV